MAEQVLETVFGTRFFVPTWWVRAYEAACGESSLERSVLEAATVSGLTPRLTSDELNGFTVILASLQQQLFMGESTLNLDPERHRKFITSSARSKATSFDRAIQEVTAIKLMHADERGYHLLPLFTHEFWRKIERRTPGLKIELTVSEYGIEALLGFGEPYVNILRAAQRKPTIQSVLGTTAPLGLGRSAWLDLQGIEQLLLLRLEKAMQWDFRWLQLDGVFGISLEELFQGVSLPKHRSKELVGYSSYKTKSKILQRFGSKLIDHGLLVPEINSQFFAVGHEESRSPITLAWQIPAERLHDIEGREFANKASECLFDLVLLPHWDEIIVMLAGPTFDERKAKIAAKLFEACRQDREGRMSKTAFWFDNNLPVPLVMLFLEWLFRSEENHPFAMPRATKGLEPLLFVQEATPDNCLEVFGRFIMWFEKNVDLAQELRRISAISLVEPTTAKDVRVLKFIAGEKNKAKDKAKVWVEETQPVKAEPVAEAKETKGKYLTEAQHKKMMTEEVIKLREKSPEQYLALKRIYFASLTPQRNEIILDLQKKLPPKLFDDTLRSSLTKFLLENPEVWQQVRQPTPH